MEASPQQEQAITLCRILYETDRVYRVQPRRFLALVSLFLFPIFTAIILFRTLTPIYSHSGPAIPIAGDLGILILTLVLLPSAVASITYTALHGFNGGLICLRTALKSISASFFPLLATSLTIALLLLATTTALAGLAVLTLLLAPAPVSPYVAVALTAISVAAVIYLLASWSLAYPVVVAEATWGFEPLRRSQALIRGKRRIVLGLSVLVWVCCVIFLAVNGLVMSLIVGFVRQRHTDYDVWLMLILTFGDLLLVAAFVSLLVHYKFLANTVLYVFCKATAGDYLPLPVSDVRVASVV